MTETLKEDSTTMPLDNEKSEPTTPKADIKDDRKEDPSVNERLAKARAQERAKVQSDMDALRAANKQMLDQLDSFKAELDKTVRLPEPAPAKKDSVADLSASLEASRVEIAALREASANRAKNEASNKEAILAETRKMLEAAKVDAYKSQILKSADLGQLAGMVQGDSIADLDVALASAVKIKADLVKEATDALTEQYKDFVPKSISVRNAKRVIRDSMSKHDVPTQEYTKNLSKMSDKEYSTRRAEQIKNIKNLYR